MTSRENMDNAVQAACDAAARGDAAKVMKCLNSPFCSGASPIGLDQPLLPISAQARYLLKKLDFGKINPEHALRALVSVPCCYETPWRASLKMVKALASGGNLAKQSEQDLWTCITNVQTFLQLTVEAWYKQERMARARATTTMPTNVETTNVTPRQMLQQLIDAILKPLDSSEDTLSPSDYQHWTQPLELVTTIVSLCQDLEEPDQDSTLVDHVLDRLFPSTVVCPKRLLPWLTLASDVCSHLRSKDWTRLHDILQLVISHHAESIPLDDLPGLVRGTVSFMVKQQQNGQEHAWELLLLDLLYSASQDATKYATIEAALKSSLASLPHSILSKCLEAVNGACASVPNWVCCNMSLLLLEAVQQSGSILVSTLVSRALGNGSDGETVKCECWQALKELAFPSANNDGSLDKRQKSKGEMVVSIKATLEGICYRGNGQFAKDGDASVERNVTSKLVCQSIFLGKTRRPQHVAVTERAQLWIQAAETILRPSGDATQSGAQTSLDVLFAILILVTVYCEAPACRATIVRKTIQCLSGRDNYMSFDEISSYYCVMVAVLVRSLTRDGDADEGIQGLYPLTDIFGDPLAKEIFCDLTTALALLRPARSVLLSVSRKYLKSSFGGNLPWEIGAAASRGMQENRDKVNCALHGLCTLIATFEGQSLWDDCRIEAWMILSEVIVRNKPTLHSSERKDLFRRLSLFTEQDKFSLDTIMHLQRACLVRLLQFFGGNDEHSLKLIPDGAFVAWGPLEASTEDGVRIYQREDFVGLFRLVMQLVEYQATRFDEDSSVKNDMFRGRDRILRLLANEDSQLHEDVGEKDSQAFRASEITCECLAASLRSAMSVSAATETGKQKRGRSSTGGQSVDRWREQLISTEIEECEAHGMVDDRESLPSWLQRSTEVSRNEVVRPLISCDAGSKDLLLSSLCDIAVDLIFHPVYSNDTARLPTDKEQKHRKKRLATCAVTLIGLKRGLSRRRSGGIHAQESELPELSFDDITLGISAVPFLELCSDFMTTSISQGTSLDAVEDTVLSLLAYCSALTQLASNKRTSGQAVDATRMVEISRQLWNLYLAVGDELSAQRFVRYLEEQGMTHLQQSLRENPTRRSFLTIRSDDDIDAVIQRVRLSVVSALGAWLDLLSESRRDSSDALGEGAFSVQVMQTEEKLSTTFWLHVLRHLSSDTKTGLDGHSGGMTEALYRAYISLVESACKVVSLAMQQEAEVSPLLQVSKIALQCASSIQEIFCRFPLNGATQFKKTLTLSLSEFPSLQRESNLMLVRLGTDPPLGNSSSIAIDVFYQMMNVTERHHRLFGVEGTAAWSEIAGADHIGASTDDPSGGDESINSREGASKKDSSAEVPSMIVIKGGETADDFNADLEQNTRKVQLPSKDAWLWASCSSLTAMEQTWTMSCSILNGNVASDSRTLPSASSSLEAYFLQRSKELSESLKAASFAMKSFKELKDTFPAQSRSKKRAATLLAAAFDDAVKTKFCMLLEKMSAALEASLRSLSNHVDRGGGVDGLVRAESMACMSSWLSVEDGELDIESLTKRWYQAEKQQNDDKARTGGIYKRMSPTLRRLPKFLVRTQELETDLGKFYQVLVAMDENKTSGRQKQALEQYESLLDGTQANTEKSLQSMIKNKLKSLAKARASSDVFNLTLVGKMEGSPAPKQKRKKKSAGLERQMRRERRKGVKRSRNQIVDEWLQLDGEYEMDEGADGDAYVDLEDFIV